MVAIELPPEIEQRLDELAHKSGRTKADYVYEALLEHLQDAEDLIFAEDQMRKIESGEIKTTPLADVMRKIMAWAIELTPEAQRNLNKLDPQVCRRILQFLNERLAKLEDPRSIGEALKGSRFGDSWKYRVGDYRVIAGIADAKVTIFIVRVGHRREIYR